MYKTGKQTVLLTKCRNYFDLKDVAHVVIRVI